MTTEAPETVGTGPTAGNRALADALSISFRILRFVMLALLVLYLFSGAFVVPQYERAFVLVFGKLQGLGTDSVKEPGFHWTWPTPLAEVIRVPAARVQTVETFSFWPANANPAGMLPPMPGMPPAGLTLSPGRDGYSLTGDANILHSRWAVRYTITDPKAWRFNFSNGEAVLSHELDRAVILATSRFSIDQALRTDLEALRATVERELVTRCDTLGLGVQVQGVYLTTLTPPLSVVDAFTAVIEAEQERSRAISAARAYAARVQNEAEGDRSRILAEGRAYQQRLLSAIQADADYFNRVYPAFARQPEVVARTLRQDVLRRVLAGVDAKYYIHSGAPGKQELRLMLGPEKLAPVAHPAAPAAAGAPGPSPTPPPNMPGMSP